MGSCGWATSLSLCLEGGLTHGSRWKHAGGMGGPKGLVTSILPSHAGCRRGRPCRWQSAEHSGSSPRARPGLPAQRALPGSVLWRSWIYAPAYPLTFCLAAREPPASHGLRFPICKVGLLTGWLQGPRRLLPSWASSPWEFCCVCGLCLQLVPAGRGKGPCIPLAGAGPGMGQPGIPVSHLKT